MHGTVVKRWIYPDQLTPVAELDSVGNVVARFAPGYMIKNDSTYAMLTDHLGSVKLVVNAVTGVVRQRIDYDEYGNVLMNTNPDFQPFGYAGGLCDEQTKLVRFGARDYDATTGRWTAKDPILFDSDDLNLYGYALNDPLNMIDPDGKDAFLAFDLLVGSIVALADWKPEAAIIMASAAIVPIMASIFETGTFGKGSDIRWNENQQALIKLAKEAKNKGAVTQREAEILLDWAKEYKVASRGIEIHPNRPFGKFPHIHIGPINKIWVK